MIFAKLLISQFLKNLLYPHQQIFRAIRLPSIFSDIDSAIKNGVDYIVQHRRDDVTSFKPSAIVKYTADGNLHHHTFLNNKRFV